MTLPVAGAVGRGGDPGNGSTRGDPIQTQRLPAADFAATLLGQLLSVVGGLAAGAAATRAVRRQLTLWLVSRGAADSSIADAAAMLGALGVYGSLGAMGAAWVGQLCGGPGWLATVLVPSPDALRAWMPVGLAGGSLLLAVDGQRRRLARALLVWLPALGGCVAVSAGLRLAAGCKGSAASSVLPPPVADVGGGRGQADGEGTTGERGKEEELPALEAIDGVLQTSLSLRPKAFEWCDLLPWPIPNAPLCVSARSTRSRATRTDHA